MKWITHQTGAVIGAFALGLPLPGVALASAGAIFPDLIDQRLSRLAPTKKGRQRLFNRIHRGPSHWFGWWLMLLILAFALPGPLLLADIAAGFAFGALSHICLDTLTPAGTPLLPLPGSMRVAMPVCSTGRAGEFIFLVLLICLGLFYFQDSLQPVLNGLSRYF